MVGRNEEREEKTGAGEEQSPVLLTVFISHVVDPLLGEGQAEPE